MFVINELMIYYWQPLIKYFVQNLLPTESSLVMCYKT